MSAPAIEVENLTVRFGQFTAVDGLNLRVEAGEIFGFLGANGAGKTTTIRVMCGLLRPTSGVVRIGGIDVSGNLAAIKRRVGYMSQRFTLYDDMTVEQNMHFAAALRRLDPKTRDLRMKSLFAIVEFDDPVTTLVRHLSGGSRQEVSLVAAMLHDPDIVFLDEPTAGVSPAARVRFWNLIGHIAGSGKTVFVTTHHLAEAEECGRVALMRDGKLIALDSPSRLKERTFQEPFFEVRATEGAPPDWIERIRSHPSVFNVTCHGLRWHLSVRDPLGFRALLDTFSGVVAWRSIEPSLEDAFLRLCEAAPS